MNECTKETPYGEGKCATYLDLQSQLTAKDEEIAALKCHVNELRAFAEFVAETWSLDSAAYDAIKILAKTPQQSLNDHDMRIAEKVKEYIESSYEKMTYPEPGLASSVRRIDLSGVIKDA